MNKITVEDLELHVTRKIVLTSEDSKTLYAHFNLATKNVVYEVENRSVSVYIGSVTKEAIDYYNRA